MRARGWLGVAAAALLALAAPPGARAEEPDSPSEPWGLAPVRWRGLAAFDLRSFGAEGEPRRVEQVKSGQLQAASYFWQPWFAQVQGGIGALASSARGGAGATDSASLTGNGMLSLFPVSRFPFQASFDVSDSRAADQFTGQSFESRRFGVRQSHRDLAGEATSSASYDRSVLVSSSQGHDTLDVLSAGHARRLGAHSLDGNAHLTRNERRGSEEHSEFTRLSARHAWSEGALMNVDTTASYGASDQRLPAGGGVSGARNELFQVTSFFSRRRDEDDPWSLTGGARYFQTEASGAADSATQSLGAHLNAAYRYSANLLLNAGASATQSSASDGRERFVSTQSAGGNYTLDSKRLGDYLYSASFGANLLNQSGADEGSRRVATAQAAHSVQRGFDFAGARALSLTLAQSAAAAEDSVAGGLFTLTHNASLMWRLTQREALAGFASASAADSRTSGYSDSVFQLVNLQLSGQGQTGRFSTLSANFTVQGTRQETAQTPAGGFDASTNGGLTYQHQRAFGVPRLRYLAIYERNDYRLNSRAQGDLGAPREQLNESFEQRLEYRIGKLEARLSVRLAELDGRDTTLLFFRLAREFGDW